MRDGPLHSGRIFVELVKDLQRSCMFVVVFRKISSFSSYANCRDDRHTCHINVRCFGQAPAVSDDKMFPPTRAVWCEVFRAVCCNNKSPVASNTNNKLPVVGGGLSRRQKSPQIQETSRRDKSRLVCSGLYFIIINFLQGSFEAWICGISDCRGITLICRIFHLSPFFFVI